MSRSTVLLIDAIVSFVLGVALAAFPASLVELLGIPPAETTFYPHILGAVVIGIALALFVEWKRKPNGLVGLGLGGAIAIDLCAAVFLTGWLLFGGVDLSLRGQFVLWLVVVVLIVVSVLGLVTHRKQTNE